MKEAFDLIRRKIRKMYNSTPSSTHAVCEERTYEECGKYPTCEGCLLDKVFSILSEVEAEYSKDINVRSNGWIDVKDRLPEKDGYYLTCDHKGNIHVFFHSPKYMEIDYAFGIGNNHSQYYQPIAWMELPKPYTGKKGV